MEFVENRKVEKEQIKAIFQDMLKYSPSKLCGMLGNAIIVPVYTSLLTPEKYGLYSISIALLSFLCILFSDWIGLSGLRFFRRHQIMEDLPKYISLLVSMLVGNLLVMYCVAFIFRSHFYSFFKIQPEYFYAILLLIIPVAVRALLFQILRAQLKSISFTLSTIVNQILTIFLSIFLVKYCHMGAMALLLGMGISISLVDLLLIYQSGILKSFRFTKLQFDAVLPIFKYGIPIAATSLSSWIITQSNKFIMNNINGFSDVGIVGVAYGLTLPLLMTIFSIIPVAAIPRIINMYEERIDVRPIISRFAGYFIGIAVPLIVVMSIYSTDFVRMLSNEKFFAAYRLIPYFAFGTFFMALADYTTLQYHLENKTYIDFIIKLTSGIIGVILNIVLIPKYGLEGAGVATLAANFMYFFLSIIVVLPGLRLMFPWRSIIRLGITFMPFLCIYNYFKNSTDLPALFQMLTLLFFFYFGYWFLSKTFIKHPD